MLFRPRTFFELIGIAFLFVCGCVSTYVPIPPKPRPPSPAATTRAEEFLEFEIGCSVEGRPIAATRFPGAEPPVLIFAGIHGDERSTVAVAQRLVDLLRESSAESGRPTIVIIPLANPDGYEHRTRSNVRRVDLNRNFPAESFLASNRGRYAGGTAPLSEPESTALFNLVNTLNPARILTIHSIRPPKHGNNFDGPAEALADLMASKNGYAVLPTMGYATPGSFGSWAGVDRQIPTVTLELPANAPADRAWNENREALLAFIRGR